MNVLVSPGAVRPASEKYRPEIDGLRAVAVLAVVMFHAFPTLVPGGYVGVDIFFVISGFLITGILLSELDEERFSVTRFYGRRVRRIFPAFVLVLGFVFSLGWFSLFKTEYRDLGKQIVSGAAFVANLAFWKEAGYFDSAADTKPLLHLWSLGVEEQFYILWPLLLAFARRRQIGLARLMLGISVVSFGVNVLLINHHPAAAFYSPFSRFWELLAGAMLAYVMRSSLDRNAAAPRRLPMLGAMLCVAAMFALNRNSAFPGWWALLPVAGASLCIYGNGADPVARHVLSRPVMVWIGKISYPLYLWHWPLLSFATVLAGAQPAAQVRAVLVGISVVLAWATCAVIEKPIRFGPSRRMKVVIPCVLVVLMAFLGGMAWMRDGFGFRKGYSLGADVNTASLGAGREYTERNCGVSSRDEHLFQFCAQDSREPPRAVVWGDSKADATYWGLVRQSAQGLRWRLIGRASCAPMVGAARLSSYANDNPDECERSNRIAAQAIASDPHIELVLLTGAARVLVGPQYGNAVTRKPDVNGALDGLDAAITSLQRAGKKVALLMDNPTLPDPRECMDRRLMASSAVRKSLGVDRAGSSAPRCTVSYDAHLAATAAYRSIMTILHDRHPEVSFFDPATVLCDRRKNACSITKDGAFLYSYGDHVSDAGNKLIADYILPELEVSLASK
ncbi:acyltransferase family protein [Caballeronia sp. LZ062]|uniref:acyltransferase family protein n=1 Tax=unclassified Caballeronia TaxID=2646786 RepID=UPI0028651080|nr:MULTISPECIES: acyltransferase family protein [unclassified Caballeronia]MDR5856735.1 acyltransferase family protein [Caballeronia sp. LZ050]MDR5869868.1 acyltransferase family protein [Caballeronia sp. LZ062]